MKNTLGLSQLIAVAAVTFQNENYNGFSKVYVSEDGFTFVDENRARIHCKTIEGLKYHPITRTEAIGTEEAQESGTLQEVIGVVGGATNTLLESGKDAVDLQELKARYEELYGRAAHHNIGEEKLKDLISTKEAELNSVTQNNQDTQNDQNLV